MQENEVRLNKYLSQMGVCSRREADRLIELKKVYVNDDVATLGTKVTKTDKIIIDGKRIEHKEEEIVLALNKPVGIECTMDLENKDNIISFINYPKRVFMVGRLDKKSQGLILLTNNGQLSDKLMRAANYHEKEYLVTVDKAVTDEFIKKMAGGVRLYDEEHKIDTITRKCQVKKEDKNVISIVLTQGINRQIRRMCEVNGYKVTKLERVRIMNVKLNDLPVGKYREVKGEELLKLKKDLGLV